MLLLVLFMARMFVLLCVSVVVVVGIVGIVVRVCGGDVVVNVDVVDDMVIVVIRVVVYDVCDGSLMC